jgi:RNA polymerase sigma-70 factor (ECF subfamily)
VTADTSDDDWRRLLEGIRRADPEVLHHFYAEYAPLLHRLAAQHLTAGIRRRVEPEDVVQSVCRTFLRRASGGQFTLGDSEELWSLLCAITLNKTRRAIRFHMRRKRDLSRDVRAMPAPDDEGSACTPLPSADPTPAEAAEFSDQLQKLLASLDDEQRQVVDLKLQDFTNKEIATKLGSSERTVRRIMKIVQAHLARQLEAADDDA